MYLFEILLIILGEFYVYYIWLIDSFKRKFFMYDEVRCLKRHRVSVVVCARNEGMNISGVLDAVLGQDYDMSRLEIIVANDGSRDETESILQRYSEEFGNIKYFNVVGREKVKSPKKNALKQAIRMATGDIILLTDADCVPTANWVSSHVAVYEQQPDTEMVAGFSKTRVEDMRDLELCQRFEHFDFLVLMFAAQGAIQSGRPFSCSGQNLSYRRDSFYNVGGFDRIEHQVSGDDVLLMQKFVRYKKVIRFAAYPTAFTETGGISSWKALLNQRARWASNLKMMFKLNIKFFLYLISCFLFLGIIPIIITGMVAAFIVRLLINPIPLSTYEVYLIIFLFMLLFRYHTDYVFIKNGLFNWGLFDKMTYINNKNKKRRCLVEWFLISPIYIVVVTFMGLFSIFRWRNRVEA